MKEFLVQKSEDGMRLQRYMEKVFSAMPQSVIYKSLRKKKVKVNGRRVTDGKHLLHTGDQIQMYISDDLFADQKESYYWQQLPPDVNVVYEDAHILLLNKPSGLLSQSETEDSLEGRMRAYLLRKREIAADGPYIFLPSLCHRIDRNTEGLVLAAKDAQSLKILGQKIREKEIRKFYLCCLEHCPKVREGILSGYIKKDPRGQKMQFAKDKTPGSVYCETRYKAWSDPDGNWAEAELLTGRTHQIRASFAAVGCPLKGDVKYGAKPDGKREYQHLRAYKLIFSFASDGGMLSYLDGRIFEI